MCFGNSTSSVPANSFGLPGNGVLDKLSGYSGFGYQADDMAHGKDVTASPSGAGYADRFRQPFAEGGDMTLGTDIPGNWSAKNILPGTDPGLAGWHENAGPVMQMLLEALSQQRGAAGPAPPLRGGQR